MARARKSSSPRGNSGTIPLTGAAEVRHFTGPIADHTVMEILRESPTAEELEVAIAHLHGESDVIADSGLALAGKAARIYEILTADDIYREDDRGPGGTTRGH